MNRVPNVGNASRPEDAEAFVSRDLLQSGAASRFSKMVDALAIVPSNKRISLLARKVYNVMLYHAQKQGPDQQVHRARLSEVVRGLDFNSNNTEVIKAHLRDMVTTKVEWQSPTKGEGQRWSVSALISHADLVTERGEVTLEWSYAPNIRLQLLNPDRYAQLSLVHIAALRSYAAVALYEICSRYVNNPSKLTARRELEWWKPVLTGAPVDKSNTTQTPYKYFKRDVLKPAIAEVNAVTDLHVELIEIRAGRTIQALQFTVGRPTQASLHLSHPPEPVDLNLVVRAIALGASQTAAESLLHKYGALIFGAALDDLRERLAKPQSARIVDISKYLQTICKNRDVPLPVGAIGTVAKKLEDTKAQRIGLIETYRDRQRAAALALFRQLDENGQSAFLRRFETEKIAMNSSLARTYKRSGLTTPMVKVSFAEFVAREQWGAGWSDPDDAELLKISMELAS